MDVVTIGPAALSLSRLLALIGIAAFLLAAWLIGRKNSELSGWETGALVGAVVLGRLVYVGAHLDAYAAEPLSVLYIWQGGFSALGMIAGGALWAVWRFRRRWRLLLPAALTMAIGVAAWGVPTAIHQSTPTEAPPLPEISLPQLGGDPRLLSAYRGEPVVVNIWASWCGPCRREMPMLADVSQARSDVTFLFVNQGESAETIRQYFENEGLELEPVLLDRRQELSRHYGVRGLPTTLFFDAQGRFTDAHMGELSRAAVLDYLSGISEVE
jgi:thiol-disulfide isomerase/thioredoxin